MAITHEIDLSHNLLRITGYGVLTNDDMIKCVDAIRNDPNLVPGMPSLSDMRNVARLEVDNDGLRQTMDAMAATREKRGEAQVAIVVSGDANFGFARMTTSLADTFAPEMNFRAFRSMADAEEWLGITDAAQRNVG